MVVSEGKAFYAYIHYKPDFTPFYVGKGLLRRVKSLKRRNPYYMATVEKYGAENITIKSFECASEAKAFELEMFVIESLKEKGIKLTNFTDGGEGASGRVATSETRAKLSVAHMGNTHSAETRAKIAAAKKGNTNALGNTSRLGRKHSAETKAKMAAWQRGRKHSAEAKAKMSAWQWGRTFTAEHRAKISASLKLRRLNAKL